MLPSQSSVCFPWGVRTDPQALDGRSFDFLIVGGGIQGAAMAREVALRGSSVLLVERADFGSGTSSKSSRLIHGGLRYLEHGHLSLVREALQERERLLRLAPHLVRPLAMLMPFFRGGPSPLKIKLGLKLYGLLAGRHSLPPARSCGPEDCQRLFPPLRSKDLRGGTVFYDARTEDQRLTLANVEAAVAAGAEVVNRVAVDGISESGIRLLDGIRDTEITVRAAQVLNAAGPGVDEVRRRFGIDAPDLVRLSRGSHLVLDPMPSEVALAAFLPDRRIQFVIPHHDGTLCGTTEVEESGPASNEMQVPADDVQYLLAALDHLYETPPPRDQVRYAYGGWRALPTGKGPAGGLNREAFLVSEPSAAGPVHTVVGGKLTTHRSFAERAVQQLFGDRQPSLSREQFLPGGAGPQEVGDPLWWRHGSRLRDVRALGQARAELLAPICAHRDLLRVEAVFALREQATVTFEDLMMHRLFHSLGPCLEPGCLDAAFDLFEEYRPAGVPADREADKARLEGLVRYAVAALLP